MAITNHTREEMNCADYCDALSKEGYTPAAIKRRLLMNSQHGSRQPGAAARQQLEKAFDERLRSFRIPGLSAQ